MESRKEQEDEVCGQKGNAERRMPVSLTHGQQNCNSTSRHFERFAKWP